MDFAKKRAHAKELPSTEEIKAMMDKEAQRIPSTAGHFPDFSIFNEWLSSLGIEVGPFEEIKDLQGVNEYAERVKRDVVAETLEKMPVQLLTEVERYLGQEDKLQKTDLAIVFGGKSLKRAEKGAEMWLKGFAEMLLMTGKSPHYVNSFELPEAEIFRNRAIELGVDAGKIIIENESINIPSNVRASLNLLDKLGIKYKSVMSIISWYAQRRAWCTLKKYASPKTGVVRVNAELSKIDSWSNPYEKGEWYKTSEGIEIVFNEFIKMKHQVVTDSA
jgi:hypothetical protein